VGLTEKPEVKAVRFGYAASQNRTLNDKTLPCMKEKVKLKLKARAKKKTKKKKGFGTRALRTGHCRTRHCSAVKRSWLDEHHSRVYRTIL